MKKLLPLFLLLLTTVLKAQSPSYQYFDGADTSASNSLFVIIDPDSNNIWQIGPPQKTIFNAPASTPNVIVTDTINMLPVNNTSRFQFSYSGNFGSPFVLAIEWKQKLDFEPGKDGGIVEFSFDSGMTWYNVFNNPYVYNFYGFNAANVDTIYSNEIAFTGVDTNWTDIWLCFYNLQLQQYPDTIDVRFTSKTDSINDGHEGWMIDNISTHITILHTAKGGMQQDRINAFPNTTTGPIHIEATQLANVQRLETIYLFSTTGQLLKTYNATSADCTIDISSLPAGRYYLKVKSNLMTETFPVILTH